MTSGPWGIDPWGVSPWGAGTLVSVVRCAPLTTHSVYIQLAAPPVAESVIGVGDALNPASWFVQRDDLTKTWTVIGVRLISPAEYELRTRTALENVRRTHRAGSTVLRNPAGVMIEAPYYQTFLGVAADTNVRLAPTGAYDLANQPAGLSDGGGTLVVLSGGNYARIQGPEFFKKLILRRLTTTPGSYFHIDKNDYGIGLKIKQPLRASNLIAFQTAVEQEMIKEPGISSCEASARLEPGGILFLSIKVTTQQGQSATVTIDGSNNG